MSFWRKLFGGGRSLEQMRLALAQKRWADAVNIGTDLDQAGVAPDEQSELNELLVIAGDGLAAMNLNEGEACLRAGDLARATEHFNLADSQARSDELRRQVAAALAGMSSNPKSLPAAVAADCHTGCSSSCGVGGKETNAATVETELDTQTRLELLLATYPEEWVKRYTRLHGPFRDAFLLAHEGMSEEALAAFDAVDESHRDDLYYFERGSLRARTGETDLACRDLEKALIINPAHFFAFETLVMLELAENKESSAETRLKQMLSRNMAPAFCHANLARIMIRRGDKQAALAHGQQAIAASDTSPETLLLTASLLEQNGQPDAAEKVLMLLPGGGCSGGPNLPLAELWLRYGKNLDKALEAFKAALRSEPDNPRWLVRVAQVYLARGWKKEAIALLEKILAVASLDPALRSEASTHLEVAKK